MLKNTRKEFDNVIRDLRIIGWVFTYGLTAIMLGYYVFSLIVGLGSFTANLILLIVTVGLLLINVLASIKELSNEKRKKNLKTGKHVFRIIKILTKAYSLGAMLYSICVSASTINPIAIIFTTLLIIAWFVSVVVECLCLLFDKEKERILGGIAKDFEWFTKSRDFVSDKAQKTKELVNKTVENVRDGFIEAKDKIKDFFGKNNKNDSEN